MFWYQYADFVARAIRLRLARNSVAEKMAKSKTNRSSIGTFLCLSIFLCHCADFPADAISHSPMVCHEDDSAALLGFKAGFGPDAARLETWQNGSNCCWWYGVRCKKTDPYYGRVAVLQLDGDETDPALALVRHPAVDPARFGAPLGDLTYLRHLILRRVFFNGPMPGPAWANLARLSRLELRHNNFTSGIPQAMGRLRVLRVLILNGLRVQAQELCSPIITLEPQVIDLRDNKFTGPIPPCVSHWYFAHRLMLADNSFRGAIPESLGNLSHVRVLDLQSNFLSGRIPATLARLALLETLALGDNLLDGPIPAELGLLPAVTELDLESNALSGAIPESFGLLSKLDTLLLSNNKLSGPIPEHLANLSALRRFTAVDNHLSGKLPARLGRVRHLHLDVSRNAITGRFPISLCNAIYVDLSDNLLSGMAADRAAIAPVNVSMFESLYLDGNQIAGTVPDWLIDDLPKLGFLSLSRNMITGRLPLPAFMAHPSLLSLDLSHNLFDVSFLPANLFDPPSGINFLELQNCGLRGPFPPKFLPSMPGIMRLDLSHNSLYGDVPALVCDMLHLHELDLSYNDFGGVVPDCLQGQTTYAFLDISNNNFTSRRL